MSINIFEVFLVKNNELNFKIWEKDGKMQILKRKINFSVDSIDSFKVFIDGFLYSIDSFSELLIFWEDFDHIHGFGDSFDGFNKEVNSVILREGLWSKFSVFTDGEFT